MRINKMITERKIFDMLSNSLNYFFKEMYGDHSGEFVYVDLRAERVNPLKLIKTEPKPTVFLTRKTWTQMRLIGKKAKSL